MSRHNLTIYDEKEIIDGIKKFQKKEEIGSFTQATTKLVKIGLRKEGLLEEIKI